MEENCATCHADYAVTPANTTLALFINYPPANHIVATCGCGAKEIIYLGGKGIMALMDTGRFSIMVSEEPTPERREAADHTWSTARRTSHVAAEDELPHPPQAWLRQLHDDLRTFGTTG